MRHDDVFELLPLYALDALEPADRRSVEGHVARCSACRGELAGYAVVADALSGEMEPSPRVWAGILERIDSR